MKSVVAAIQVIVAAIAGALGAAALLFAQYGGANWIGFAGSVVGGLIAGIVTVIAAVIGARYVLEQLSELRRQNTFIHIERLRAREAEISTIKREVYRSHDLVADLMSFAMAAFYRGNRNWLEIDRLLREIDESLVKWHDALWGEIPLDKHDQFRDAMAASAGAHGSMERYRSDASEKEKGGTALSDEEFKERETQTMFKIVEARNRWSKLFSEYSELAANELHKRRRMERSALDEGKDS